MTLNGIVDLQDNLHKNFDLPSLMTSHCDQDYVEGAFKDIRKDSRGGIRKPTALGLCYRLQRYIILQNLNDSTRVDIFQLENILKIEPLGKNFIDNLNAVCTCFLYCSHVCSTVLIWAVCYVGASIKGSIITKVIFDFVVLITSLGILSLLMVWNQMQQAR